MREFGKTWGWLIAAVLIPVGVWGSRTLAQQEATAVAVSVVAPVRADAKEAATKAEEVTTRVVRLETQRAEDVKKIDEIRADVKDILREIRRSRP